MTLVLLDTLKNTPRIPFTSYRTTLLCKKLHRTAAKDFILHITRSAVVAHGKNHQK